MKHHSISEIRKAENTPQVRAQKIPMLRTVNLMLAVFAFVMLIGSWANGYRNSSWGTFGLLAILLLQLLALRLTGNPTLVFVIGDLLQVTCMFVYILAGTDRGGSAVWFWFLATPPLAVYIAGLYWGFWDILYSEVLLLILLWTPVRASLVPVPEAYLSRLPVIYFVIGAVCLAASWSQTQYQLQQEDTVQEFDNRLHEATERRRIDRMTGLLNREWAEEQITAALAQNRPAALFLMDLDNFKMVNDLLGHQAGDHLLADFARLLRRTFGTASLPARLGGDEFIVFVPDNTDLSSLAAYAEALIRDSAALLGEPRLADKMGVSIGIALAPEDGTTFDELYHCADKGQYYAKRNGKGCYSFYRRSSSLDEPRRRTGADIATLRRMVQEFQQEPGAFEVEYGAYSKVYQYLLRNLPRTQEDAQVLLFTLQDREGLSRDDEEACYAALRESIRLCLRAGDLLMEFSRNQIAVLLTNCGPENCRGAADRILAAYGQQEAAKMAVQYERDSLRDASLD